MFALVGVLQVPLEILTIRVLQRMFLHCLPVSLWQTSRQTSIEFLCNIGYAMRPVVPHNCKVLKAYCWYTCFQVHYLDVRPQDDVSGVTLT